MSIVPSASVVIPAYNARKTIRECLAALSRQTFGGEYEVIVVDDDSTDETGRIVQEMGAKCFSVRKGGPAKARNLGIEKARGEIVLFTDADCIPAENWMEKMTEPLRDDSVAGVKGVYRTKQRELTARFAQYEYEEKYTRVARDAYIDFVDTYSAAYRRSVLVEQGGFNTTFPIATGEDAELSFRLAGKGYKMVFQPEAIVYHVHVDTPWKYFKRKFKQPYWRIEVVRRHPRKLYRDSHTPQSQKLQLFLFYPILLGFMGVVSDVPFAPVILLLSLSLFMISAVSLTTDVLKKDRVAGLLTPLFLLLRASAYGFGLVAGIGGFLYRNTVGKGIYRDASEECKTRPMSKEQYHKIKRAMDIVGAMIGLTLSIPLFIIVPILIKLDSPGPVFYRPQRVTKGERRFRQWKFRSMQRDADKHLRKMRHLNEEPTGLIIRISNDPRLTRIGRFLRRSSIDEVPQFINVLKGDMSLVGPRPPSVWEVERYNSLQKRRLEVKPGLTGLWQISGRKDTGFHSMVHKDIEYVERQGLWTDLRIIRRTIPCLLSGKGAR